MPNPITSRQYNPWMRRFPFLALVCTPAQRESIDHTAENAKANDPSSELIHYHLNPVRTQRPDSHRNKSRLHNKHNQIAQTRILSRSRKVKECLKIAIRHRHVLASEICSGASALRSGAAGY